MISVIFRVWKNNQRIIDINAGAINVNNPADFSNIIAAYKKAKAEYHDAEVMFMIEHKLWQGVSDVDGEVLEEDIIKAIRGLNKRLKQDII